MVYVKGQRVYGLELQDDSKFRCEEASVKLKESQYHTT